MNNRLRTEATSNLLDAARAHSIGTFVKESITFTYPDCGNDWIDESIEIGIPAPAMRTTIDGEQLVEEYAAGGGRGIVLRFGWFVRGPTRTTPTTFSVSPVATSHRAPVAPVTYTSLGARR